MKLKDTINGITLIALVITIIILLILAGVTIAVLSGDNGLLNKTASSKVQTEIGKEKELIALAANHAVAEDKDNELTYNAFNAALKSAIKDGEGRDYELNPEKNSIEYRIKYLDTNRCYKIDIDGIVTEIASKEFENISSKLSVKIRANSVHEYNGKLHGEVYLSLEGEDSSNSAIWSDIEKVKIATPGESTNDIIVETPKEVTNIKVTPLYAVSGTVTGSTQEVSVDDENSMVNYTFEASEDLAISNSTTAVYAE